MLREHGSPLPPWLFHRALRRAGPAPGSGVQGFKTAQAKPHERLADPMPKVDASFCVVGGCHEATWPLTTSQLCEKHLQAWKRFLDRWSAGGHLVATEYTLKAVAAFHKTGKIPPHRAGAR
jgi:hypothetical protein